MSIVKTLKRSAQIANVNNKFSVLSTNVLNKDKIKCYLKSDVVVVERTLNDIVLNLKELNPHLLLNKNKNGKFYPTFLLNQKDVSLISKNETITENIDNFFDIDTSKPLIIAQTKFQPIFKKENEFTEFGKFLLLKSQYRLEFFKKLNELIFNISLEDNIEIKDTFLRSKNGYSKLISQLNSIADFFVKSAKIIHSTNELFDVRDISYIAQTDVFLNNLKLEQLEKDELILFSTKNIKKNLSIDSTLVNYYGYLYKDLNINFSSTKTFIQFLNDYKELLVNHSNALTSISVSTKFLDSNKKISNEKNIPDINTILNLSEITSIDSIQNIESSLDLDYDPTFVLLNKGFNTLQWNTTNTDKILYLLNTLSKILRYSNGLSKQSIINELATTFNFQVTNLNSYNVFDVIFGYSETDAQTPITLPGINSLAYDVTQQNTVFNFEPRKNVITEKAISANEYYIDYFFSMLRFDGTVSYGIDRLEKFNKKILNYKRIVDLFAKEMNWLCISTSQDVQNTKQTVVNSKKCFNFLLDSFIDKNSKSLLSTFQNDHMMALVDASSTNSKLRTALFLWCLNNPKNNQTRYKVPLKVKVLTRDKITKIIFSQNVRTRVDGSFLSMNSYIEKAKSNGFYTFQNFIKALLNSPILNTISNIMFDVLENLYKDNDTFVNLRTKYHNLSDTTILMMLFDTIVTMLANYSTFYLNDLIGVTFDTNNRDVMFVSITSKKQKADISWLTTKLDAERAMSIASYIALSNTLGLMSTKIEQFIGFFSKNKGVLTRLFNLIPQTLRQNPDYIKHLFSEQQLLLHSNKINELQTAFAIKENFVYDFTINSNSQIELMNSIFTKKYFTGDSQKTIISVGIPNSLTQTVNDTFYVRNGIVAKQHDLINLVVNRIDNLNPEIIYKPLTFLFEMSRFPIRVGDYIKSSKTKTFEEIALMFPTRDQFSNGNSISIGDFNLAQSMTSVDNIPITYAFLSSDYELVNDKNRTRLFKNHLMSYVIELYIDLLSDVKVNELKISRFSNNIQFNLKNNELLIYVKSILYKLLIDNGIIKKSNQDTVLQIQQLIDLTPNYLLDDVIKRLSMLHYIFNTNTILNGSAYNDIGSTIFSPKLFDRVFNLLVDVDDFVVDVDKMSQTTQGKKILQTYINDGILIETNDDQPFYDTTTTTNKKFYIKNNLNSTSFDTYTVELKKWTGE